MPKSGRRGNYLGDLVIDPDRLGEDSEDEDFDPKASHASPSKRSRSTAKKGRSTSNKPRPSRRRRDEYEDEDDDDLSRGSWSASEISEEEDTEMTAAGRPSRRTARSTKNYQESSEDESDIFDQEEEEEDEDEAVFTDDEDVKPKSRKAKAGKIPHKQTPKKAPASSRRSARSKITPDDDEDDEEELSVPQTDDENETPRPNTKANSLLVVLKLDKDKFKDFMTRKGSNSGPSGGGAPGTTRRSSRLASLPPENTAEDLPVRTRGKSREPTQSPSGRNRRSRSTSSRPPTAAGKAPAATKGVTRRLTRSSSKASSEGSAAVEDEQDDVMQVEQIPGQLAMSRITEESTQTSSNRGQATNGETSGSAPKDGEFQPGMTSTSTAESLETNVNQRELTGLLLAPDLTEENDVPGRKLTRSSVALKKETIETGIIPGDDDDDEDEAADVDVDINMSDEDEEPVVNTRRTRASARKQASPPSAFSTPRKSAPSRKSKRSSKESDDEYEAAEEEEEEEDSDAGGRNANEDDEDDDSEETTRGRRSRGGSQKKRRRSQLSSEPIDLDLDELAEEARVLGTERKRTRREARYQIVEDPSGSIRPKRSQAKQIDYRVFRPEDNVLLEEDQTPPPTVLGKSNGRRGKTGSSGGRPLFNTLGPFGGIDKDRSILNSDRNLGLMDSDSSDDDIQMMPAGGSDAITPLGTGGKRDSISRTGGIENLGKITSAQKQNLADADPLGVDPKVDFSKVGGLAEHINQLKEMVALPLMYPEIFQNLGITPPRGVLFHGPPGTGKTLLARALANSCSANGKSITFYMRKGADILSKWVGEAERQVRILFEDARKNAPSIIFFDEIDGLAPVRSSKQDQIHASIVSTLLALMDGMDGRGQVIVIGATNRPDSVDPALRRPGRFDREFYFPLPDKTSRRAIIDIHTSGWTPPLSDHFKSELASLTKGYGGADLRALCTEAALNAVQRKYPQIYRNTDKKYLIDPKSIEVTARDFMLSVDKIVPSSERSSTSGAAPLPEHIAPLLTPTLAVIKEKLEQIFPKDKKQTALQEAEYEPYTDADGGFGREKMLKDFESTRIFKPRMLIHGPRGMGQGYLGAALLHQFEGFHVQTVSLPILMGDPAKNAEATLIQLFTELRRHKPSVLYIPDLENWVSTVTNELYSTFLHLVGSINSSERILLLGMTSADLGEINALTIKDLFPYSRKGRVSIAKPDEGQRHEFFERVVGFIRKSPREFPDPTMRPKRKLEELPLAPPPPPKEPTKQDIKKQKQQDKYHIHQLKVRLMPIIEMLKAKYKRFRRGFIAPERFKLWDLAHQSDAVGSDLYPAVDIDVVTDANGVEMILDIPLNRKFYNIDLEVIEERVFNGYYITPTQFMQDITHIMQDTTTFQDRSLIMQGQEMNSNVEILVFDLERENGPLISELHSVWKRVEDKRKQKESARRELRAITETDENSLQVEPSESETPVGPGASIVKKTFTVGTPSTPLQQAQMQMMPPVLEESESNGYNASSEMGQKGSTDSDGDALMSDIPGGPGNGSSHPPTDSNQSSTFKTAAQSMVPQPGTQQATTLHTEVTVLNSNIFNTQSGNVTQKSGTGRYGSAVGISSTQTQFEQNTMNASTTTSGKKTSSQENSNPVANSSGNRTDVPQETPPARPIGLSSDFSGGSGSLRHQQLLHHASTTTGYEHPIAFGDSQLPDTQPLASSEGSAPSQFAGGLLHFSTQATGPYSNSSQQSPLVPFGQRGANAANLPGPSSAPPVLRRPPSPDPPLQLDEDELNSFHRHLVEISEGFTIEQIEQINAEVMDLVWQFRGKWDRNEILIEAREVISEVQKDIEEMDKIERFSKAKLRTIKEDAEFSYRDVLTSEIDH